MWHLCTLLLPPIFRTVEWGRINCIPDFRKPPAPSAIAPGSLLFINFFAFNQQKQQNPHRPLMREPALSMAASIFARNKFVQECHNIDCSTTCRESKSRSESNHSTVGIWTDRTAFTLTATNLSIKSTTAIQGVYFMVLAATFQSLIVMQQSDCGAMRIQGECYFLRCDSTSETTCE